MNWLEALLLGLVQGLTEFLPVSSSGHLELGKAIMGIEAEKSLIFRKDIVNLLIGLLKFKWNDETKYITKLAVSMIPVFFVGMFFEEQVESLFNGNLIFVGSMLLVTAVLLAITFYAKSGKKELTFSNAFIIGVAQAVAVLPGISRSGSTIATGLLLGNKKNEVSRFSFLMVLVPVIGANILSLKDLGESAISENVSPIALIIGFIAAFISGFMACRWMISIDNKRKLIWFSFYVLIVGIVSVIIGILA